MYSIARVNDKNKIQVRQDLNLTAAYSLASHPLKTLLRKQAKIKILTVNVEKSNSLDLVIISFHFYVQKPMQNVPQRQRLAFNVLLKYVGH